MGLFGAKKAAVPSIEIKATVDTVKSKLIVKMMSSGLVIEEDGGYRILFGTPKKPNSMLSNVLIGGIGKGRNMYSFVIAPNGNEVFVSASAERWQPTAIGTVIKGSLDAGDQLASWLSELKTACES